MDETEIIEKVLIGGRVFIPEDSLPSEQDKMDKIYEEREWAVKNYIEMEKYKRDKLEKQEMRCKICRCYCGCHPCRHTKPPTPTKLNTK